MCVTLGGAALAGPIADLPVERYQLANGLKVVLAPDPSLEEASVIVHYDVGSADDPPEREGLAHLVEQLMFDGSRHVALGEFFRSLARAGATDVNGRTSLDATNYTATLPPASLPLLFWLESDRMGFVSDRLNQQTFDNERRVIADEKRDRLFAATLIARARHMGAIDESLASMLGDVALRGLGPTEVQDRAALVAAVSGADVRAVARRYFAPEALRVVFYGRAESTVGAQSLGLGEPVFTDIDGRPAAPASTVATGKKPGG